jgi:hypothetical protein
MMKHLKKLIQYYMVEQRARMSRVIKTCPLTDESFRQFGTVIYENSNMKKDTSNARDKD